MIYVFLLRLGLSLLFAFLAVRRFRAPLRALVIRAMPLKMRMSEKAFERQIRISNIIGISAWLLMTVLIYALAAPLARAFRPQATAPAERLELAPMPPLRQGGTAPSPPPESQPAAPEQRRPTERSAPAESTAPQATPLPQARTDRYSYYLQLGAYRSAERAWESRLQYEARLQISVWVGHQAESHAPYKVLAGPFGQPAHARAFRRRHQLPGFARQLETVRLYQLDL